MGATHVADDKSSDKAENTGEVVECEHVSDWFNPCRILPLIDCWCRWWACIKKTCGVAYQARGQCAASTWRHDQVTSGILYSIEEEHDRFGGEVSKFQQGNLQWIHSRGDNVCIRKQPKGGIPLIAPRVTGRRLELQGKAFDTSKIKLVVMLHKFCYDFLLLTTVLHPVNHVFTSWTMRVLRHPNFRRLHHFTLFLKDSDLGFQF